MAEPSPSAGTSERRCIIRMYAKTMYILGLYCKSRECSVMSHLSHAVKILCFSAPPRPLSKVCRSREDSLYPQLPIEPIHLATHNLPPSPASDRYRRDRSTPRLPPTLKATKCPSRSPLCGGRSTSLPDEPDVNQSPLSLVGRSPLHRHVSHRRVTSRQHIFGDCHHLVVIVFFFSLQS